MAEESVNLLITQGKSESSGYSPGNSSERNFCSPGNESGVLPENHRTSPDSSHDFNNPRRNSTDKPSPRRIEEEIVSRYLRASTGSCHDFCKYGKKHAFEEKEIRPWRKRIIKAQSAEQNLAETVPLGERKKTTVHKQIASPDMTGNPAMTAPSSARKKAPLVEGKKAMVLKKMTSPGTQNSAATATLNERKKATVIKQMTSSSKTQNPAVTAPLDERKKATVLKHLTSPDRTQNPALNGPLGERKKTMVLKQMMSPDRKSTLKHKDFPSAIKSEDYQEIVKQEFLFPSKKVEASSKDPSSQKKTKVEKRMNKISSRRFPSVQTPLMKQLPSFHSLASAKKAEKAENTADSVSQKRSPSVGHRAAIPKASSSFGTSEGSNGRGSKRRDNVMKNKNMVVTKAPAKKVAALPTASLDASITTNRALKGKKSRSLKLASSWMDQNNVRKAETGRPENENVPEKTLHVVLTEIEKNISESTTDNEVIPSLAPQSFPSPKALSQCQSPFLSSQEEGEIEDYDSSDEVEVEEGENGYACEEMDEVLSDKDVMANNNDIKVGEGNHRKTVQKGGVYSESEDAIPMKMKFRRGRVVDLQSESNVPRRLRFRRVRVMDDSQDRRSEIRRNFKKKGDDADRNVSHPPSNEKVVLRHQDVQGKRDAQGLFNNVIEETASKLVESRKSKVKALVGAFETVISLQDIKPSS